MGEEVRPDALLCGLVGHGLGAVLAKLKHLPVLVRTGPGATLAVEPSNLVDLHESFGRSNRTHFADPVEHGVPDGRNAGSLVRRHSHSELAEISRVLRLLGSGVGWIQFHRGICANSVHSLLPQVSLVAIVSVSAPLIPVDYLPVARRYHYLFTSPTFN